MNQLLWSSAARTALPPPFPPSGCQWSTGQPQCDIYAPPPPPPGRLPVNLQIRSPGGIAHASLDFPPQTSSAAASQPADDVSDISPPSPSGAAPQSDETTNLRNIEPMGDDGAPAVAKESLREEWLSERLAIVPGGQFAKAEHVMIETIPHCLGRLRDGSIRMMSLSDLAKLHGDLEAHYAELKRTNTHLRFKLWNLYASQAVESLTADN